MIPAPVAWLLILAAVGMGLVYVSRPGGVVEMVGSTLALASLVAIPVGIAMGQWSV